MQIASLFHIVVGTKMKGRQQTNSFDYCRRVGTKNRKQWETQPFLSMRPIDRETARTSSSWYIHTCECVFSTYDIQMDNSQQRR